MARTSQLARADDAGDARGDPLRRELSGNLLPRRFAGACQSHSADQHLRCSRDADRAQPCWHPGADRGCNAAELDQCQTQVSNTPGLKVIISEDGNERRDRSRRSTASMAITYRKWRGGYAKMLADCEVSYIHVFL